MALLLHPGDPLPPLVLRPPAHVADHAGHYLLILCGEGELPELPADVAVLRVRADTDPDGETARRLGVQAEGERLAVLVDPAGRVLRAEAGETWPEILALVRQAL